jgi:hypothetical protein
MQVDLESAPTARTRITCFNGPGLLANKGRLPTTLFRLLYQGIGSLAVENLIVVADNLKIERLRKSWIFLGTAEGCQLVFFFFHGMVPWGGMFAAESVRPERRRATKENL